MRKMILFVAVFFIFDRFMNYKLNSHSKKSRIVAENKALKRYVLLSEKKERTSTEHKKIIVAHAPHSKSILNFHQIKSLIHSSNRNV